LNILVVDLLMKAD